MLLRLAEVHNKIYKFYAKYIATQWGVNYRKTTQGLRAKFT